MPELPDVDLYLHALRPRLLEQTVRAVRIANPFLVRSTAPPPDVLVGQRITEVRRLGKRIVLQTPGPAMVIHLMIAGRFQWKPPNAKLPGRLGLMALDVDAGTLLLTEAGSTRRASVHLATTAGEVAQHDPGGLEVLECTLEAFTQRLTVERHTLKRSLTDPTLFAGIGNAYSDEILHHAKLSPLRMSDALPPGDVERLHQSTQTVLSAWRDRLIAEAADQFPTKVTAFRPDMAVHGKYGQPCPDCGTLVQRLRYAANEANYCPTCQTGGRLLADRALSRLLKEDWPRSLEDLERHKAARRLVPPGSGPGGDAGGA